MSIQTLREFINRHNASAAGLAALGAALEARASGTPLEPALGARVDELLAALGAADALEGVSAQEAAPLLAELRFMNRLEAGLLDRSNRTPAWNFTDPVILQGAGDVSAGFALGLTRNVAPALEGLSERLARPGAAFLDVGVGVAGLAIAMARLSPGLRIVGVDPWQPSLRLARENVSRAGLADRIELREQGGETLEDEATFDLAWLATAFMPERIIPQVCARAHHALRPGGWLLFGMVNPGENPQAAALMRLRTVLWGGPLWTGAQGETVLREIGLVDVRTLPSPPGALTTLVAGRRKPE
jgi:SAM-dependent methyltransferase